MSLFFLMAFAHADMPSFLAKNWGQASGLVIYDDGHVLEKACGRTGQITNISLRDCPAEHERVSHIYDRCGSLTITMDEHQHGRCFLKSGRPFFSVSSHERGWGITLRFDYPGDIDDLSYTIFTPLGGS